MMYVHFLQPSSKILHALSQEMDGGKQDSHLTTTTVTTFTATSPTKLLARQHLRRPTWMPTIPLQRPYCTKFAIRITIVELRQESTISLFTFIAMIQEDREAQAAVALQHLPGTAQLTT